MTATKRLGLIAAGTALLMLIGGTGAFAYWFASSQLAVSGSSATVGIEQVVHPAGDSQTPLAATYSASALTAAGAVSITNTGSREAVYSLALQAASATEPSLPGAIIVAVAPVANEAMCTPDAALSDPVTGALSAESAVTATGEAAAGATVILCVQTSISAATAAEHQGEELSITLQSLMEYAPYDAWRLGAPAVTFSQSLAAELPSGPAAFVPDESARYHALHEGIRICRMNANGTIALARNQGCSDWESEWRLTRAESGSLRIWWSNNNNPDDQSLRLWTAVPPGDSPLTAADSTNSDAQRWFITESAEGMHIESAQYPGFCATIGAGLWNPPQNPFKVILAACDDLAPSQLFDFAMIGNPHPATQTPVCTGSPGFFLNLAFSDNAPYQGETVYRAFFARESTPTVRVPYPIGSTTGWTTVFQVAYTAPALHDYVNATEGGLGNTWVYVERQVGNTGIWTLAAEAQIRIAVGAYDPLAVNCGWQ